jgi:transposase
MGKLTRAANYLMLEQVREKMKESKDTRQLVRWQIVYTALLEPRKAEDIAMYIGASTSHVKKIISRYNREGIQSIEIKKSGGRYHEYLTKEEEKEFLAPFFERASQGELTTTREIHRAYEERERELNMVTTVWVIIAMGLRPSLSILPAAAPAVRAGLPATCNDPNPESLSLWPATDGHR